MKTKNLVSILLIVVTTTAFSQIKFDLEKGNVKWTGKKITNQAHSGSLKFSSASLSLENSNKPFGVFTVDMTSLTSDDLTGEWKQKLEGHLKSDDFFYVEKHPEATLVIKKVNSQNKNSYELTGVLTIKGITQTVDFNLIVYNDRIESKLTFDRSKHDIQFASGSFFENLGDTLILDEITLDITLQKI
ncbi:lipid-binding protein [Formosa sp. Hel1_33_131]|uniref:YceI family protein n=1 Tax=Formosa sp. Hel1_33_131 TaxID=1336794 RepID=UPI00084E25C9|nr:YceI family protein [Formosa sp. Hel1_33_131]AOR28205.1 lipid-binding protein [Formosa sp. Hel1_33_131]